MGIDKDDLKILEINPNEDGSAEMTYEISDDLKEEFKTLYGFKRFSKKAFNKFLLKALRNAAGLTK